LVRYYVGWELPTDVVCPRVKIRNFKRDINSWVSFFSYAYIFLLRFLLLHLLLHLLLSLAAFSSHLSRGAAFILTNFHLYFAWCHFIFSVVFICISIVHWFSLQQKQKLPTRQIYRKHPKSINKLIVCKFTDGFLSLSVITDRLLYPLVITEEFRVNLLVNPSQIFYQHLDLVYIWC